MFIYCCPLKSPRTKLNGITNGNSTLVERLTEPGETGQLKKIVIKENEVFFWKCSSFSVSTWRVPVKFHVLELNPSRKNNRRINKDLVVIQSK